MKKVPNSLKELPNIGEKFENWKIKRAESKHLQTDMDISFFFEIPKDKQDLLELKVNNGEILTAEELNRDFIPEQEDINNLISWLQENGFKNIRLSNDKCSVYATGKAQIISNALKCDMVVVSDDVTEKVSAKNIPSLPNTINHVKSINGLQPFRVKKKNGHKINKMWTFKSVQKKTSYTPPFLVNHILTAYNGISSYTGINQTIGILIDTAANNSDLTKFWQANNIPNNLGRVTNINVRNVRLPNPTGEESLDVEWTSGIAKDAKIRVYCSGDLSFTALDLALDRMYLDASNDPTFRQVSVSLGLGENFISSGELATENNKYLRLKALGVNCFISSGDSGSQEGGQRQVAFPASNPNVIAVGGTRLSLSPINGSIVSETAWNGSGGGTSVKYSKPTWQPSGTGRLVPDVSAPADPATGAYVVLAGFVYQFGGTSWSAPIWAGICALINDARVKAGKPRIGFLPPLIYNYLGTSKFRDITSGNNIGYSATIGYDKVTGIGTPNINNLISAMVSI